MPKTFTQNYTSETEMLYDNAKTSIWFDKNSFASNTEEGNQNSYLNMIAQTKNIDYSDTDANLTDYNRLSSSDKDLYVYNEMFQDRTETQITDNGEIYNVYKTNKQYLDQQVSDAIDQEIYDSTSTFSKIVSTVGGVVGGAIGGVVSFAEGIIDFGAGVYGSIAEASGDVETANRVKEFIASDLTGYRTALQDYVSKYTNINKDFISTVLYDVAYAGGQMIGLAIPVVGTLAYYTSAAGNSIESALQSNPEMSLELATAYGIGIGVLEKQTEKISKIFGGSTIDKLVFKTGVAKGTWVKQLGFDFISEGFEESVSEFVDDIWYRISVDPTATPESIGTIAYAGLIGGLLGFTAGGIRTATMKSGFLTKDGQLVSLDYAEKNNLEGNKLSKAETYQFSAIQENTINKINENNLSKLQQKYNTNIEDLKTNHLEEYNTAISQDNINNDDLAKQTGALIGLLNTIGEEQFTKSVTALEENNKAKSQLIKNYIMGNYKTATVLNKKIQDKWALNHSGNNIIIYDTISDSELQLQKALREAYGKTIVFADFGSENGKEYNAVTLDSDLIVIKKDLANTMTQDNILKLVVKEELSHSLQYYLGKLSPQLISQIKEEYYRIAGNNPMPSKLAEIYNNDSELTKLSEVQAKTLAEALCFDELTINKVFVTKPNIFNKVYNFLNTAKNNIYNNLGKNKNKVRFNELNKILNRYKSAISLYSGNNKTIEKALSEIPLSAGEISDLYNNYLPYTNTKNISLINNSNIYNTVNKINCERELMNARIGDKLRPLEYNNVFDYKEYTTEFYNSIIKKDKNKGFAQNLQEFLLSSYNCLISSQNSCLIDVMDINQLCNNDFLNIKDYMDLNSKFSTLDKLLNKDILPLYEDLSNVKISYGIIKDISGIRINWYPSKNRIVVLSSKKNNAIKEFSVLKGQFGKIINEVLADKNGMINGTSPTLLNDSITENASDANIKLLSENLLDSNFYEENKDNKASLILELSKYLYKISVGDVNKNIKENINILKNKDGFINSIGGIQGYGIFSNIFIPYSIRYGEYLTQRSKDLQAENVTESFAKENKQPTNETKTVTKSDKSKKDSTTFKSKYVKRSSDIIQKLKEKPKTKTTTKKTEKETKTVTNDSINTLLNTTYNKTEMSEVQKITEANQEEYVVSIREFTFKNEKILNELTNDDIRNLIDTKLNNDPLNNMTMLQSLNASQIGMWVVTNKEDFDKKVVEEVEQFLRKTLSFSGKTLGLWSSGFEKANPIFYLRKFFKHKFGKELVLEEKDVRAYNKAIRERDYGLRNTLEEKFIKEVGSQLPSNRYKFMEKGIDREERLRRLLLSAKKINGFRYFAMLTSPSTHLTNLISNVGITGIEKLSYGMLKIFDTLGSNKTERQLRYRKKGINIETSDLEMVEKEFGEMLDYVTKFGKYDIDADVSILGEAIKKNTYKFKGIQMASDLVFNTIAKIDRRSVRPRLKKELTYLIKLNYGSIENVPKKEIGMIIENATSRVMNAYLRADNGFTKWWETTRDKHWSLNLLMGATLPFARVTANITKQIFEYSPFSLVRGLEKYINLSKRDLVYSKKFKKYIDASQGLTEDLFYVENIRMNLSKGLVCTSLMTLGAILGALGIVGFDEDDQYGNVVLRLGDVKISISQIAPSLSPIILGSALIYCEQYPNFLDRMKSVIDNLTVMGTFNDMFGYDSDLYDIPIEASSTYFTQFVPAILRNLSKITDTKKKITYDYDTIEGWFKTTFDRIISGIPFVKRILPNKINPYTGEPMVEYGNSFIAALNLFIPTKISLDTDTIISNTAKELGAEASTSSGSFTINGTDYSLTGKAKETMQKNRATYINSLLTDLINNVTKVTVQGDDGSYETINYSDMNEAQKKRAFTTIYTKATNYSKIKYWIDSGHKYYTSSYEEYISISNLFGTTNNIRYIKSWSKSKFID